MPESRLAVHSQGKVFIDEVFDAVAAAGRATAKYGKAEVIDATIGTLCDEQAKLVFLPTVEKAFRSLPNDDIAAYGSVRGLPEYLSATIEQTCGQYQPEAYIEAVATAGGAGAVHNIIWNYSNIGDSVLTHDWHWQPYTALCNDIMRKLETFSLHDENLQFNIKSFEMKVHELIVRQDNLVIILNTPNHNPTGYSLTDAEWDQVLHVIKHYAVGPKTIVLLIDSAYMDYLSDRDRGRAFIKKFSNLPKNIFVTFAFSLSKGFTLYGQRTGAAIGVSSDKNVIAEFIHATTITCRTRWSSVSRAGMKVMANIYKEAGLLTQLDRERSYYVGLLQQRATVFTEEAKTAKLKCLPYSGGFFLSVPTANPTGVSKLLRQNNIFAVPLAKGLRIAVCAVPINKMQGLAAKVTEAIGSL